MAVLDVASLIVGAGVDAVLAPGAPPAQRDAHHVGALRAVVGGVLRLHRAPFPPIPSAQHDRRTARVENLLAAHGQAHWRRPTVVGPTGTSGTAAASDT